MPTTIPSIKHHPARFTVHLLTDFSKLLYNIGFVVKNEVCDISLSMMNCISWTRKRKPYIRRRKHILEII